MEEPAVQNIREPERPEEMMSWFGRVIFRMRQGIFLFLEVIGLRKDEKVDQAIQVRRLKLYHIEFRKLISANNSFLETMAELEQKLMNRGFVDRAYIRRKVMRVIADIHAMVDSLDIIAGPRYPALREALDRIGSDLTAIIGEPTPSVAGELVRDISALNGSHADLFGGKMANLGEARNTLGLPTPEGFAVTTQGFKMLVEENGIRSWIKDREMELLSTQDMESVSNILRDRILKANVPKLLEEAILGAYDVVAGTTSPAPPFAVRSSALGEDSILSFAGQFLSVLNVKREGLLDAYLRVVASLYSPEAISYRLLHGVPGESAEMAVGFITMVDAEASGVAFSRDPHHPESGQVLIQAVWGLPVPLVEGSTSPEAIFVSRENGNPVISRTPSQQKSRLSLSSSSGLEQVPLDPEQAKKPCMSDDQAAQLARWTCELEAHFGGPQDIEWAIDRSGRLVLLQSRLLRLPAQSTGTGEPVPGARLLLRGGEAACPGVGFGPAVHMHEDDPLGSFPDGGVLVAPRSSPKFIRLMSKARAIVTDFGGTTGHMASLARELRIPTLLNTAIATQMIPRGAVVTVDATNGLIYEGEVPLPAAEEAKACGLGTAPIDRGQTPELQFLEEVVKLVLPLNLTDPQSPEFRANRCMTLHDLARFIHEKSYEAMFTMGQKVGDLRASSYYLDVFLPIDLYVIDLGGGFQGTPRGRKVKRGQIASVPLTALLAGMLHEKIPRFGPRPIDLRGFFSVMMHHASTSPEEESTFRDPCYAIVSDNYLNYTARVGYHFSVVDTYCSSSTNKNYISLFFGGGAADYVRRSRRARAIAHILKEHGFSVRLTNDLVNARLGKAPRDVTVGQLKMIGSLLQFFRQMDAAMASDETVQVMQDAFLRGDYDLKELSSH
jgi:pyruvate,water dikinase